MKSNTVSSVHQTEFVALMAFMMSNVAFVIDALLPAISNIGSSFQLENTQHLQYIVSFLFIGLALGQLVFGLLSDSLGRKRAVYLGALIFFIGTLIAVFANSLSILFLGRIVQGFGLAAFRTVSISIVRDSYTGNKMAKILSFVMVVFIIVPMVAPLIGKWILSIGNWQTIFMFQFVFASITLLWFVFRQKETLPVASRVKMTPLQLKVRFASFFSYKNAVIYTVISGLMEGAFVLYLSTSVHVFQGIFNIGDQFTYWFSGISLVLGGATLFNGLWVSKIGMRRLSKYGIVAIGIVSLMFVVFGVLFGQPSFTIFVIFLLPLFIAFGFVFGNVSALAMEPVGHMAGLGASIFSFSSTLIGGVFSMFFGWYVTDSVLPLFLGFSSAALLSIVLWNLTSKPTI